MNFLKNKAVLVGLVLVVLLIVAVLLVSGALKFSITATRTQPSDSAANGNNGSMVEKTEKTVTKAPETQKPLLADRAVTFKDSETDLEFSIKLPLGWSTSSNPTVDFVAGSLTAENLPDGSTFYANLNALVGAHPSDFSTFADYQDKWMEAMLAQYPSMESASRYSTKIDGMDVYVIEVSNTRPDGLVLRQMQYVFYVNNMYGMVVTTTTPLSSWAKYDKALKMSVESIKLVSETNE